MSLPMSARVGGAVCLLIVLALNLSTFQSATSFIEQRTNPPDLKTNILDGCHHVYLDMGTNMYVRSQTNHKGTEVFSYFGDWGL